MELNVVYICNLTAQDLLDRGYLWLELSIDFQKQMYRFRISDEFQQYGNAFIFDTKGFVGYGHYNDPEGFGDDQGIWVCPHEHEERAVYSHHYFTELPKEIYDNYDCNRKISDARYWIDRAYELRWVHSKHKRGH